MLNGFVIKGNTIAQLPLAAAKEKAHALKRPYFAISISIFVHLLLALLLFFMAEKQQIKDVKIVKQTIDSYLYKIPAKSIIKEKEKVKTEAQQNPIEQSKAAPPVTPISSLPIKPAESVKAKLKTETKKTVRATFSAFQQLNSLRNSINEKIMADELSKRQQFRSPSVMHGEQVRVPHSNEQLTAEQEREKNTTRMSDDISITKYDNGICTIERKQMLVSPIEGSSSAFACGESKFDRSFREHMKKVQQKLLPVKSK